MRTKHLIAVAVIALTPSSLANAQDRARIPQGPQGTVTLPVGDYNRLVDRASQPDATPEPPPIAAVVGRAELRGRVAGDTVRGTLRLDGEVFQRGLVKVPLVAGATLTDARMDGRTLPLLHDDDVHVAVLPGPAPFAATVEWAAPISASPGRASFALPAPAAGSISGTLDLPGDPAEVRIEGGLVTKKQASGGRTTVDVSIEPGRHAQVSWSVRETAATVVPAASRTLADVRSLVTIGEADLRIVTLADLTVVQGEPQTFEVRVPAGYDVTSVTGNTLDTSDVRGNVITLTVRDGSLRRHQFLIGLEQAHAPGSFKMDTSFPTVTAAQREAGEIAIEGVGTIDVTATGDDGLRRMDVRETHAALRSLARQPLLAAFRYQRRPEETRVLTLDVKRFADAAVIAAVAERAVATTLVTTEGRTLTEVVLSLRNRAQPFMKVTLPAGATMLSVEVAGETAKPVIGADGTRVPLLRTGFRPDGVYSVSFVYLNAGEAFAKRGDAQVALPKFDVPVSMLDWELFLPDNYSAKPNGGNVIPAYLSGAGSGLGAGYGAGSGGGAYRSGVVGGVVGYLPAPGEIAGRVVDPSGAVLPGASVIATGRDGVRRQAVTDANGQYVIRGVPSGNVSMTAELVGFVRVNRSFTHEEERPRTIDIQMQVARMTETVEVRGAAKSVAAPREEQQAPSQNVLNLQRRVSGVLPVRVDVPRTGVSYRFVRPLVLDEETNVSFRYRRR